MNGGAVELAKARLQFIVAVVLYGTIGTMTRFINLPSEVVVLVRGSCGALFVLLFQLLRGKRPDVAAIRANLRWLVISGICLGFNWIFLFAAYAYTTVAIASLCNYMAPIIVLPVQEIALLGYLEPVVSVLGSALVLHEPLGVSGAIGAALVIAAAALGETVKE